jgi:ribosomal small subunit protein bTHX
MGRGDRKTRKGKISIRSYGNSRPHTVKKSTGAGAAVAKKAAPAAPRPAVKKAAAPVKKAAAKKSV